MKTPFNWKRALVAAAITLPTFLAVDVVVDKATNKYDPAKLLGPENLFFKGLACVVVGYFAGTSGKPKNTREND